MKQVRDAFEKAGLEKVQEAKEERRSSLIQVNDPLPETPEECLEQMNQIDSVVASLLTAIERFKSSNISPGKRTEQDRNWLINKEHALKMQRLRRQKVQNHLPVLKKAIVAREIEERKAKKAELFFEPVDQQAVLLPAVLRSRGEVFIQEAATIVSPEQWDEIWEKVLARQEEWASGQEIAADE